MLRLKYIYDQAPVYVWMLPTDKHLILPTGGETQLDQMSGTNSLCPSSLGHTASPLMLRGGHTR